MPTWFHVGLKIIQPLATPFIAACVAVIGLNQWKDNREKLRLDLFNRRFDIYLRVLDYYISLSRTQNSTEQLDTLIPFIKAVRESRFMFPEESGVHEFLEEFQTRANEVANYTSSLSILRDMPAERAELTRKQNENTTWVNRAIIDLEGRMEPYVRFERL